MRITFICGSLEPGRDGVGDYTRRLAEELHMVGHVINIVAYNDLYLHTVIRQNESELDGGIAVLRIPATTGSSERILLCRDWIKIQEPDLISVQFVPYAFHPRGLPFRLTSQLKRIAGHRQWHIMFHELWIGIDRSKPLRSWIIRGLQQHIIRRLRKFNCRVVHTQLPVYLHSLKKLGFSAKPLPLFSNIKRQEIAPISGSPKTFRIGIFSQIAAAPEVIEFIKVYAARLSDQKTRLEIYLIGANDSLQDFGKELAGHQILNCRILSSGFLDFKKASHALSSCHLALTSVPRHALGKSGSVAAFLSHNKPVAAPVIARGFEPFELGFFSESLKKGIVTDTTPGTFLYAQSHIAEIGSEIDVQVVARTLISDVQRRQSSALDSHRKHRKGVING